MAVGLMSDTARIVLLKHDDASWQYVPQVCERLAAFCRKYESEANPDQVVQTYKSHFLADDPLIIAIVALHDDQIVGHLLVSLDTWMGTKVATILQYEHDAGALLPPETLQKTFAWLRQWAQDHGAYALQALVRDPKLSKTFVTNYGFKPKAVILRQPVGE